MLNVVLLGLRINQNIIQVNNYKVIQVIGESGIHKSLKGCRCVHKTKRHDGVLIQAELSQKSGLVHVLLMYPNLMIATLKVNL